MTTIKKGDTLPCGGVVTFVASTGYYFTPKGGGSRQWVATQAKPAVVIDYVALHREQDAAFAAKDDFYTRDNTEAIAASEKARQEFDIEVARILALAGVSTHQELMGSVPWAAQYLPYEKNGELVIYNNTGETRGVWNHASKSWVWQWQNNRGTREDVGSSYGANTHGTE